MAIDPNIALGVRPMEPLDITKLQQLRNLAMQEQAIQQQISASQASEALTRQQIPQVQAATDISRAQLPGTVATSARLEEEARLARQNQAANDHILELVATGKYTTKAKDEAGNEFAKVDYPRLYGDLSAKFPQQAITLAAGKAKTDYDEALARAQAAVATKNQVEARGVMQNYANSTAQTIANIVDKSGLPIEQRGREFQVLLEAAAKQFPEAFKDTPYTSQDANGNIKMTKLVSASDVKKIADGSLDPLTAAKLAISQAELRLAEIKADPRYIERISVIPSSGERGAFAVRAQEAENFKKKIDAGLSAKVDFAKYGRPGSIVQAAWDTLVSQNREYAILQAAVDAHNAATGEALSIPKQGTEAVKAILEKQSGILGANVKAYREISGGPNISEATGKGTAPVPKPGEIQRGIPGTPPAPAPAPAAKTVKMINQQGQMIDVHPDNVKLAQSRGYKLVPEKK